MTSSKTSAAAMNNVIDFIKAGNLQKASQPGFAHALKLSYNTIDKSQLSTTAPNDLRYHYSLSADVPRYSVGLLSAIMDELSTDACFRAADPCPPGVSLQMQTQWLVDPQEMYKRNWYTRTDFCCPLSKERLAMSTHVKYLPTGSWFMDKFFTTKWLYSLVGYFTSSKPPPFYPEKPIWKDVIDRHLEYTGLGRAVFHVTPEHVNPFGSLHGGCHAMVMERVGLSFAKTKLVGSDAYDVVLVSQNIDFLRAAKGPVEVVCESLSRHKDHHPEQDQLHVHVTVEKAGKLLSDGKLRFVRVAKKISAKL